MLKDDEDILLKYWVLSILSRFISKTRAAVYLPIKILLYYNILYFNRQYRWSKLHKSYDLFNIIILVFSIYHQKFLLKCLLALHCRMQTLYLIKSNQIFYYYDSMIQQQQEIPTFIFLDKMIYFLNINILSLEECASGAV